MNKRLATPLSLLARPDEILSQGLVTHPLERSVWSTLLCKWSAVFDAMLQSEMQEGSGRGRIEIKDFSHEVIDGQNGGL